MSNTRQFGSPVDRRALLRGSLAAGITLPFSLSSTTAARQDNEGIEGGTPVGGYVGSDPEAPTTGQEEPTPAPVKPFQRRDPFLEEVQPGPRDISLTAEDQTLYIAPDVKYAAWTFNGSVPAPFFHVEQGEEINFHFSVADDASTGHSVDFHASQTAPDVNYKTIYPGDDFSWSFTPKYPGAYLYHCGTPPVLMHIAAGMYGAMIVRPRGGWPTEAQEIVLVQGDFYVQESDSGVVVPNYEKMFNGYPIDHTAFNGHTTQYVDEPIKVEAGKPIRIYVVNAGPNVYCTFHVVGGQFDAAYFNANPENRIVGQQSMTVGPGDGAAFELTLDEPGLYTAVNHAFGHAAHGAMAILQAE